MVEAYEPQRVARLLSVAVVVAALAVAANAFADCCFVL